MPLLVCGGGVVSIVLFVFGTLKSTDVYTQAVSRATASAEVKQLLGEPVTAGFWVGGNIQINPAGGHAELVIPISGPKGSAMIQAVATKSNDKWDFSKLEVVGDRRARQSTCCPPAVKPRSRPSSKLCLKGLQLIDQAFGVDQSADLLHEIERVIQRFVGRDGRLASRARFALRLPRATEPLAFFNAW